MAYTPITIGGILLDGLEIPETLETVGGKMAVVVHDFPGGLRTIRNLGAFPHELSFHGLLTGTEAFDRMFQLERLFVTGQQTVLNWGPVSLQGEVVEFEARPKHEFFIPYTLRFIPVLDLTGVISSGDAGGGFQPAAETQLGDATVSIDDIQLGTGSTLPTSAGGATASLDKSVTTESIVSAGGT